jgi:hypothetical protein
LATTLPEDVLVSGITWQVAQVFDYTENLLTGLQSDRTASLRHGCGGRLRGSDDYRPRLVQELPQADCNIAGSRWQVNQ